MRHLRLHRKKRGDDLVDGRRRDVVGETAGDCQDIAQQ